VNSLDFRAGFASARKAVKNNGLFYFNSLNSDFEIAEKNQTSSSAFFIDVVINEPHVRLIRLNQTSFNKNIQHWVPIYLIEEGNGADLVIGNHQLRSYQKDQIIEELESTGFQFQSVTYSDVQGIKKYDMFILAQAV